MDAYPVNYAQSPPEERNRLTVFFRGLMIIPHYFVGIFYGFAALICVAIAWFALMFTGKYPEGLYNLVAGFARFTGRVSAYYFLITDEFPPFDGGEHPEYPVQIQIPPPQESYSRMLVFFRYFLLIPVRIISFVMALWIFVVAIGLWFSAVFTGKTSAGLTESMRMPMAYTNRANAYGFLLTDGFPPFDPGPNQIGTATPPAAPAEPTPSGLPG